jgi:hypothetical protein
MRGNSFGCCCCGRCNAEILDHNYMVLTVVCNTRDYWMFGDCASSVVPSASEGVGDASRDCGQLLLTDPTEEVSSTP